MDITDKIDIIIEGPFPSMGDKKKKEMLVKKKGSGYESWTYFRKGSNTGGKNRSATPIKMPDFNNIADAQKWAKKNGWTVRMVEGINENILPTYGSIRSDMSKGLKDVTDITNQVATSLLHYFERKMINSNGVILKTQSSNKLADELWHRIGKSIEDTEQLTDDALKKLKSNFYKFIGKYGGLYTMTKQKKGWEAI